MRARWAGECLACGCVNSPGVNFKSSLDSSSAWMSLQLNGPEEPTEVLVPLASKLAAHPREQWPGVS